MNTNSLKVVACFTWAAVAVSSATPANALAITTQVGEYASCSNATQVTAGTFYGGCAEPGQLEPGEPQPPYLTTHIQQIKFVTTACSSGGCNEGSDVVYTDMEYAAGRKQVSIGVQLCAYQWLYFLGACAC